MIKNDANNAKDYAKITVWEQHWEGSVFTPPRKIREFTKFAKRGKQTRMQISWHMYLRSRTRVYLSNENASTIYFNSIQPIEWTMYQYQPVDSSQNIGCENQELGFNN